MSFYFDSKRFGFSPNFMILTLFLAVLWIAGGASRADVWGQTFVRAASWICLAAIMVFGSGPARWRGRPVLYFLAVVVMLALVQLIPLPPSLWGQLPGREAFVQAAVESRATAWRPIAVASSSAINAVYSLIVPVVAYLLMGYSRRSDDGRLVALLLGLVFAMMVVGLVQMAGVAVNSPFVNGSRLEAGMFANRNHFALFLAVGCLLAPVWAFYDRTYVTWRAVVAFSLVPLFLLTILTSGSRAGMVVGVMAFIGGLAIVWKSAGAALRRYPRWVLPALIGGFLVVTSLLILFSIGQDRALSISRVMTLDTDGEMRKRALPTVLAMIQEYFPVGSGFGGFDAIFRMHEPDALLKPTYFNHAHNDFLEVVLDGGLAAVLLLCAVVFWWAWATIRAWLGSGGMISKLGSLIVLVIAVASAFDYPVRTPIMMALLIIAAVWLNEAVARQERAPLPGLR